MNSVMFSIMVPVYQVEKYIDRCILSVLNQTYSNFELILVDDGTRDNSGNICDEYAKKDNRIKVFHKENEGLLATRRFALSKASGEYYIFLDSDDTIETNLLEIIAKAIEDTSADCVIYGLRRIENGKEAYVLHDEKTECMTNKRDIYVKCFTNNYNAIWRKAVRSTVFDGRQYKEFYFISYLEDLIQSIEILENSNKIVFIPDILYNYYGNEGSITQEIDKLYKNYDTNNTTRYEVYKLFSREKTITHDDLNILRKYNIMLLLDDIDLISAYGKSIKEKKAKISEIINSAYFKEFIAHDDNELQIYGKRSKVFKLLKEGKINQLLFVENIRKVGSKIKRKMYGK